MKQSRFCGNFMGQAGQAKDAEMFKSCICADDSSGQIKRKSRDSTLHFLCAPFDPIGL
jgi:hypothetical protein